MGPINCAMCYTRPILMDLISEHWSETRGLKYKIVEYLVHLGQRVMQVGVTIICGLVVSLIMENW